MSKRWLMGAWARSQASAASLRGCENVSIRLLRRGRIISAIQRGLRLIRGLAIAAAGRGGIEEVYGVPYLDVGCDVCFHEAWFTTSPH